MKIAELIIKSIIQAIKNAILIFAIGAFMIFALLVLTIILPEQVLNAYEIITGLMGS